MQMLSSKNSQLSFWCYLPWDRRQIVGQLSRDRRISPLIAGLFNAYPKASSTKMIASLLDAYSLLIIGNYEPSSVVSEYVEAIDCSALPVN